MLVTVITPSNAAIFPEYIVPNIRHLIQDPEVLVRCTYAQCIVQLADTAVRYLEMGQALKAHGTLVLSPDAHDSENARFEVSSYSLIFSSQFLYLIKKIGIVRCEYARVTGSYPRSSIHPPGRPFECC